MALALARSFAALLVGTPLLFCGCSGLDPCPGVSVGAKYRVEVGELTDTSGNNCAGDWGFAAGTILTAEIVDVAGRDVCESGQAKLTGNASWNVELTSNRSAGGGSLVESGYSLSQGTCAAEAQVSISCAGSCLSGAASSCACSMSLVAYKDQGTCPASCAVVVAASVTRL